MKRIRSAQGAAGAESTEGKNLHFDVRAPDVMLLVSVYNLLDGLGAVGEHWQRAQVRNTHMLQPRVSHTVIHHRNLSDAHLSGAWLTSWSGSSKELSIVEPLLHCFAWLLQLRLSLNP